MVLKRINQKLKILQQIGELIAVGGSAKVFKGLNMKNGQFVAIKEIQLKNESFIDEELPKILVSTQKKYKYNTKF